MNFKSVLFTLFLLRAKFQQKLSVQYLYSFF